MMEVWDLNPLTDFKANLTDILSMRLPSENMHSMKVTYPDLLAVGLSADTMLMFGYTVTMLGWINLGFRLEHLSSLTDAQITVLFGLTRQAAELCFIHSTL